MDKKTFLPGDITPPDTQDAAAVHIVFVGSKINFPDCLFRTIDAEIDGCHVLRLATPVDLSAALLDASLRPRLVVVDDSLWAQMNDDVVRTLRVDHGASIAIAFRDAQRAISAMAALQGIPKAISFLPMNLNIESWLTILRLMLTGYPFVPSEFMLAMQGLPQPVKAPEKPPASSALDKLTRRESEVLALVAEGYQNKHIAERLDLSEHTVKLHLHHVISKLGARNRTDAALRYRRQANA